jgi:mono/diheme cytochrome c family protein
MRRPFVLALLGLSMCGRGAPAPSTAPPISVRSAPPATEAAAEPAVAPVHPLPIEPLDAVGAGSANAVALARLGERTLAFVADADDRAVVTFDVDAGTRLASTSLGARPSAVLVTRAGRVVALGADDGRVHVLALVAADAALVVEAAIDVPDEPVSAALTPAGDTLLVTSRWGHALSVVTLGSADAPVVIDLPRDPVAVVASSDGRRAVVLHAAGSRATEVDLASHETRTASLDRTIQVDRSWGKTPMPMPPVDLEDTRPPIFRGRDMVTLRADQAFAVGRLSDGRFAAPTVALDTGADASSGGYGGKDTPATPALAVFDAGWTGEKSPEGQRVFGSHCLLPRAAALDAAHGRLLVACVGSDEVAVVRLRPGGAKVGPATKVAAGPLGIAVDAKGGRAVVWSAFARVVSVVALERFPKVLGTTALPRTLAAPDEAVLRGRSLFHAVFEERVSADGRACASCHPDGRDDGLTWSAPGGRRQTPMLIERLEGTAPYGWDASGADLAHHVAHTTARLGGTGLRKRDVEDIAAYLATLHPPTRSPSAAQARIEKGAALFASEATECASCHTRGGTDGERHDVEAGARRAGRRGFDTPSLHLVGHSAPYFHDGRYATLGDLLAGVDGTMGHTAQLSPDDRAALTDYLETL